METNIEQKEEQIFYAFRPKPEVSITDWEEIGFNYRSFRCTREKPNMFYAIAYEDGTPPPVPLQGRFTEKVMAKEAIDAYLFLTRKKQAGES